MKIFTKNKQTLTAGLIIFAASFASGLIFTNAQTVPAAEQCTERNFITISNDLRLNIAPTNITEDSFRSWATADPDDLSGDIEDIKAVILGTQCELVNADPPPDDPSNDYNLVVSVLEELKTKTTGGRPTKMTIDFGYLSSQSRQRHAIIALGVTKPSVNNYTVSVLDSTVPSIETISCSTQIYQNGKPYMVCLYPPAAMGAVSISYQTPTNNIDQLIQAKTSYCANSANQGKNICTRNVANFLQSNFPLIPNFIGDNIESSRGVCAGWADFVLKVAYLGDFVGECSNESTSCVRPDGTTTSN